jgi:hypothetical protein
MLSDNGPYLVVRLGIPSSRKVGGEFPGVCPGPGSRVREDAFFAAQENPHAIRRLNGDSNPLLLVFSKEYLPINST